MLDDEEAVQQLERHCGDREEVESDNHLAVIPKEGKPPLARVAAALDAPQIPRDGPFRDDSRSKPPTPVEPEACAVPADDGPWLLAESALGSKWRHSHPVDLLSGNCPLCPPDGQNIGWDARFC
jgi:hypothetical protein